MAMTHVHMVADHDHPTMMVLQLLGGLVVDLFDAQRSIRPRRNFQQGRTSISIPGRAKYVVATDKWGWNVRSRIGHPIVVPKQFACRGIVTDDPMPNELNILLAPRSV